MFEMTNAPTSSATTPNTARITWRKRTSDVLLRVSSACARSPVMTSTPSRVDERRATISSSDTPSAAATHTLSMRPSVPASRCASASVNSTETAPPALADEPDRNDPTTV